MKFTIKHRHTGSALFTAELSADYESKVRSVKLGAAVQMAVQAGADLTGADLEGAKLRNADLQGANLQGANLRNADLQGANLQGANLRGVDLRGANLRGVDLRDVNLRIYHGIYSVIVTPSHVHIGCERRTPEKWLALTEDEARAIDGKRAVEALRQDGPVIKAMIEQVRPDLVNHPAAGERLNPYTQGYSDGYLEGFERGMRHAPNYWLETAAREMEREAETCSDPRCLISVVRDLQRQPDQPANAGEPDCCAKVRADERERCARIADQYMVREAPNPALDAGADWAAREIVTAIRQGGDHE